MNTICSRCESDSVADEGVDVFVLKCHILSTPSAILYVPAVCYAKLTMQLQMSILYVLTHRRSERVNF